MKSTILCCAFAVCGAIAGPVLAADRSTEAQRIDITAPYAAARSVLNNPEQDLNFQLDNGRRATVTVVGDSLQLMYRHRRCLLKHDGNGGFVSGDGRVSLTFAFDAAGEAKQMAISAPASWF